MGPCGSAPFLWGGLSDGGLDLALECSHQWALKGDWVPPQMPLGLGGRVTQMTLAEDTNETEECTLDDLYDLLPFELRMLPIMTHRKPLTVTPTERTTGWPRDSAAWRQGGRGVLFTVYSFVSFTFSSLCI